MAMAWRGRGWTRGAMGVVQGRGGAHVTGKLVLITSCPRTWALDAQLRTQEDSPEGPWGGEVQAAEQASLSPEPASVTFFSNPPLPPWLPSFPSPPAPLPPSSCSLGIPRHPLGCRPVLGQGRGVSGHSPHPQGAHP